MKFKHTLIFGGRFQPFHLGHVEVVRYLSDNFDSNIIIGIVNPDPEIEVPGDDKNWVRFGKDKNPLNYWERYNLIYLSLKEFGLLNKLDAIVPLPRPSINLERAENYLSPKPRKFVLCNKWNDEVEVWKSTKYIQNGEEILWIPFDDFSPVTKLASGELIRSLMTLGNLGWKTFFPNSVKTYIEENNLVGKITAHNSESQAKDHILNALKNEVLNNYLIEIVSTFSINMRKPPNIGHSKNPLDAGLQYFSEFGNILEYKGFTIEDLLSHFKNVSNMQEKNDRIVINVNPTITNTNQNNNNNSISTEFKENLTEFEGILNAIQAILKTKVNDESREALKAIKNLKKEIEAANNKETKTELKKTGFVYKIKNLFAIIAKHLHLVTDEELIKNFNTVADKLANTCN